MKNTDLQTVRLKLDDLTPYENNAKEHPEEQLDQIRESIQQFGFCDPIAVWGDDNTIVEGHGRYLVLKEMGETEVDCIRLDHLTDEERRAYTLAHNKLTMNSGFDFQILEDELDAINDIDMSYFGFNPPENEPNWFEERERYDNEMLEDESEEYQEFVKKFEAKRTTDDCYTPDLVYNAIADHVAEKYGLNRKNFVRPFYPGGDYQKEKYKATDVVVDNPPFSILMEIIRYYKEHGIRFFLFAPSLTSIGYVRMCTVLQVFVDITYENGASVRTSFVTNLEPEDIATRTDHELYEKAQEAADTVRKEQTRELPKYSYPNEVVTAAMMGRYTKYDIPLTIYRSESVIIDALDSQKEAGKAIYGHGLLLSERAAAERAAAKVWKLSERERELVLSLERKETS